MRRISIFAAVLCLAVAAQAGFVPQGQTGGFLCTFDDDPAGIHHSWGFDDGINELTLSETVHGGGVTFVDAVRISGTTEMVETSGDSGMEMAVPAFTFHIAKTVTNQSASAWTSYNLQISDCVAGSVSFVDLGNTFASAPYLQTTAFSSTLITFSGLDAVAVGQTVTLEFDVAVDSTGAFNFCLEQNPVPEPATMAILGLGSLVLMGRKK